MSSTSIIDEILQAVPPSRIAPIAARRSLEVRLRDDPDQLERDFISVMDFLGAGVGTRVHPRVGQ